MAGRNTVAIELTAGRLRAVAVRASSSGVSVRRVLVRDVPAELSEDDVSGRGAWIRSALSDAGISRKDVVWQIGREHVVIKRLSLPSVDPAEWPDMVRLALTPSLP